MCRVVNIFLYLDNQIFDFVILNLLIDNFIKFQNKGYLFFKENWCISLNLSKLKVFKVVLLFCYVGIILIFL